jgi:hypothetical protein
MKAGVRISSSRKREAPGARRIARSSAPVVATDTSWIQPSRREVSAKRISPPGSSVLPTMVKPCDWEGLLKRPILSWCMWSKVAIGFYQAGMRLFRTSPDEGGYEHRAAGWSSPSNQAREKLIRGSNQLFTRARHCP